METNWFFQKELLNLAKFGYKIKFGFAFAGYGIMLLKDTSQVIMSAIK